MNLETEELKHLENVLERTQENEDSQKFELHGNLLEKVSNEIKGREIDPCQLKFKPEKDENRN